MSHLRIYCPKSKDSSCNVKDNVVGLLRGIQKDLRPSAEGNLSSPVDDHAVGDFTRPPLEQLPLSPLIHPSLIAARQRHLERKPSSKVKSTEFEIMINKNPFGIVDLSYGCGSDN